MALTEQQKAALEAEAARQGVDAEELIAEAEVIAGGADERPAKDSATKGAVSSSEPPKLFQYHLAFVRVREVRKIWLGLEESFPGDDEIAAEWAAKHGGGSGGGAPPASAPAA